MVSYHFTEMYNNVDGQLQGRSSYLDSITFNAIIPYAMTAWYRNDKYFITVRDGGSQFWI